MMDNDAPITPEIKAWINEQKSATDWPPKTRAVYEAARLHLGAAIALYATNPDVCITIASNAILYGMWLQQCRQLEATGDHIEGEQP